VVIGLVFFNAFGCSPSASAISTGSPSAELLEETIEIRDDCIWVAGIWACCPHTRLYFMFDLIGATIASITHPGFSMDSSESAWHGRPPLSLSRQNPQRFRPLMIPSILEKASLAQRNRPRFARPITTGFGFAGTDLLLGLLFIIAYFKTSSRASNAP